MWKKRIYNPSKKSIFSVEQDNGSEDETAGEGDDNVSDTDFTVKDQMLLNSSNQPQSSDTSVADTEITSITASSNTEKAIADRFVSSVNISLKLPVFPLTSENSVVGANNRSEMEGPDIEKTITGEKAKKPSQNLNIEGVGIAGLCVRPQAECIGNEKLGLPTTCSGDTESIGRGLVAAVGDSVSQDEELYQKESNKTKIAWVTLGTCSICQSDLNSLHASKLCHKHCANDNDGLVLEEVESTAVDINQCNGVTPSAGEKANWDGVDGNDIIVSNVNKNALPKPKSGSNETGQTETEYYKLPCDECHDVQPSESFEIQEPNDETLCRHKVGTYSLNDTDDGQTERHSRSDSGAHKVVCWLVTAELLHLTVLFLVQF